MSRVDESYGWLSGCRFAVFAERYPPQVGGVARSVARFCAALRARGAQVDVINRTDAVPPGMVEAENSPEGTIHRLGVMPSAEDTLQMLESLVFALHGESPFSLFHAFWLVPSGYVAVLLGRLAGVPSYVCIRGNDLDRGVYSARQFPFLTWTLEHAGAVSAVSSELARKAQVLSGLPTVHFVPNSVDADTFSPRPPHPEAERLREGGAKLIGFVGELRLKKGMPALLGAFQKCRARRPLKLLVIGNIRRTDRTYYRDFLRANPDIRQDIVLVPYVEDRAELASYYCALDLLVCPSLWEGMPNSVLEAMACGRLVLATKTGGMPDVIEHGKDGFLLDCSALGGLDEAITELLDLGERARTVIQANARRKALQRFLPEHEFERHARIYRRLLSI